MDNGAASGGGGDASGQGTDQAQQPTLDQSASTSNAGERSDLSPASNPLQCTQDRSSSQESGNEDSANRPNQSLISESGDENSTQPDSDGARTSHTQDAAPRAESVDAPTYRAPDQKSRDRDQSQEKTDSSKQPQDESNRGERSDLSSAPRRAGDVGHSSPPKSENQASTSSKTNDGSSGSGDNKKSSGEHERESPEQKNKEKPEEREDSALQRGLSRGAEVTAKTLEASTSEKWLNGKAVTAIQRAATEASSLIGKGADMLAKHAPDGAARAIYRGADNVQDLLGKTTGNAIKEFAESRGFKAAGAGAAAFSAMREAKERDVGKVAEALDAGAAAAINTFEKVNSPVDAAINAAHIVISAISPKAGEYTGVIADATPSRTATNLATGAIDTVVAIAKGDAAQLERHADHNLQGKYGGVIRGYAIAADALGATLTGDSRALNQLSNAAAGGELGVPAKVGDAIGDWAGKHVPIPQSVIRFLGL